MELVQRGYDVVVADNFSNCDRTCFEGVQKILNCTLPLEVVDFCDKKAAEAVFAKYHIDAVIHFAAFKAVGESVDDPLKYYGNNLESFVNVIDAARKHGCDVLLFCDPVDEYLTESLREFDGHSFVDIGKGDVQFGSDEEKKAEKDANEKSSKELKPFLESVKKALEAQVSDVRVSTRLTDSPCCLVAQANAMPPSMVRMMRAMHQEVPDEKRILEINPSHPLIAKVKGLEGDALADAVTLLYDSALIAEGSPVTDGARFTKLLSALMMK